jgi:Trypsin-like peptidase domain
MAGFTTSLERDVINEKGGRMRAGFRSVLGFAAILCMPLAMAQDGQRPAKRVGSEHAIGGLTIAEQAARQLRVHGELTARMPAGVNQAPLEVGITQQDRDDLAVPAAKGFAPLRIGVVKPVAETVGKPFGKAFNRGVIESNPDGSFVWAMTVRSPGAQAIRVHLTGFSLPDNTEMYFISPRGQAHGPYTGEGRNGNGDFWTRSIASESGQLVLRYTGDNPNVDKPRMAFVVSDLGHIRGRKPDSSTESHDGWPCSDNAPCMVDVNCTNTGPAGPAEDAVAKMEWISGAFINTCSGGLLADTDSGSQIPYFLTANHCFTSDISNLETFFNYTTDSCNGGCPDSLVTGGTPPPASTIGITVVATGSAADFTLATLDQAPPAGATFLGWNNIAIHNSAGANLYRISNANFGPQVYSQHDVDPSSPTCTGWNRGPRIYSVDQTGATMGGSSGSPVVNSAGEVVGQLSGCCGFNCADDCDAANNWTVDGAFAYYWDSVSEFLDPSTGGCTSDAECNDGQFCTGVETCVSGSCQSSGDPCSGGETCNEGTDSCDPPSGCDNDGTCEAGEDCNNCPNDCRRKTNGNPNGRYCCDGDLPECGDSRCSESGWSCGGGGGCTSDPECDDGQFCNGAETCSGGSCQGGSDPCPGQGCDEGSNQCVPSTCGNSGDSCSSNGDCCSNKCKRGSCRGG